ncbi:Peptidase S9 domain containing protein, protein [Aphelenchoides besseyi]|nr:Peptidase S9 domain containing protein, protein [Aphelenchoides besseyi]
MSAVCLASRLILRSADSFSRSIRFFHSQMPNKTIREYGGWTHALGTKFVTQGGGLYKGYSEFQLAQNGTLFTTKTKSENGFKTLFRRNSNTTEWIELKTVGSVKNSVNEYGAAAFYAVAEENYVYTAENAIHWFRDGEEKSFTQSDCQFADLRVHDDSLYCVVENRQQKEYTQLIGRFNWNHPEKFEVIASGDDFYASPRVSSNGRSLIYMSWNEPNMPWDKTTLHVVRFGDDGNVLENRPLLSQFESADFNFQAVQWKNDDEYFFISDFEGYWNVYKAHLQDDKPELVASAAPFDIGDAQWCIGQDHFYAWNKDYIVYQDCRRLYAKPLNKDAQPFVLAEGDYTHFTQIHLDDTNTVFCVASGPMKAETILQIDITDHKTTVLDTVMDTAALNRYGNFEPERFVCEVGDPDGKKWKVESFFFSPSNPHNCGPRDRAPPVIILAHGGPTGQAYGVLDRKKLFFLSHGFALCDVNYRGSTGFGRDFRRALYGQWGEGDVRDLCETAKALINQKKIDPNNIFIMGGSSGGYSLLRVLYREPKLFKGAVCSYGFADLFALAAESHRFERAYNYRLIAPAEDKDTWNERNMSDKLESIKTPVQLFHGKSDPVVSWKQSEDIRANLKKNGVHCDLVLFDDEGHGFRNASTIEEVLKLGLIFMTENMGVYPMFDDIQDPGAHL